MIFGDCTAYAKVWKVDVKDKYTEVRLSTSRKDKKTDKYINSNWSFVRFVGDAHAKAATLAEGDKIIIKRIGISNEVYEKDKKNHFSFAVFDYDDQIPAPPKEDGDGQNNEDSPY